MDATTLADALERVLFQHRLNWTRLFHLGDARVRKRSTLWSDRRAQAIFDTFVASVDASNVFALVRIIHFEVADPPSEHCTHLVTLLRRVGVSQLYAPTCARLLCALAASPVFDALVVALATERRVPAPFVVRRVVHRECARLAGVLDVV